MEGGGYPCHFLKIEKSALILEKHAMFVCIYGLNSYLKCNFKIIFEKKHQNICPRGLSFVSCAWNVYWRHSYILYVVHEMFIDGIRTFCMLCLKCLSKAFAHFLRYVKSERKIFWSRFYYNRNTLQESGNNCANRISHSIYSKLKVYHIFSVN